MEITGMVRGLEGSHASSAVEDMMHVVQKFGSKQ